MSLRQVEEEEEDEEHQIMVSQGIGFEELAHYFHLPINQVSKELGICATVLKKICRRNGIPRWPHRKIKSLDRMIKALETTVPNGPEEQQRISKEIEEMRGKKLSILKNPNTLESPQKYKPNKSNKQKKEARKDAAPYDQPRATTGGNNISSSRSILFPHQQHQPVPSSKDIAITVSEIMTNLKARRDNDPSQDDHNNMRFNNSAVINPLPKLPSPTASSPHDKLLSSLLPLPINPGFSTTQATLSIMSGNSNILPAPFSLPRGYKTTESSTEHLWDAVTIAPLVNQAQQSTVPVLPVLEPPVDSMNRIREPRSTAPWKW